MVAMWIQTNHLRNDLANFTATNDSLKTYINTLGQRVYDLPTQTLDPSLIDKLAKVDSSYNMLKHRIKELDQKNKDLIASLNVLLEAKGTVNSTYVTNEYYENEDSTKYYRTFHSNDGLLDLNTTVASTLDSISNDYKLNLGNIYVDIFGRSKGRFNTFLTFDNPKLNLVSQSAIVARSPIPNFAVVAGAGVAFIYSNKTVPVGPGIGLFAGYPLYIHYKYK